LIGVGGLVVVVVGVVVVVTVVPVTVVVEPAVVVVVVTAGHRQLKAHGTNAPAGEPGGQVMLPGGSQCSPGSITRLPHGDNVVVVVPVVVVVVVVVVGGWFLRDGTQNSWRRMTGRLEAPN
jgi:hypothetical protein